MVLELPKFTFGVGDRFAHQAGAQLAAFVETAMAGVEITPVWNKSNREHLIIGSEPASVRKAADEAIAAADWQGSYFVDADHINLETVDRFVSASDFYTIDVADAIGSDPGNEAVEAFVQAHPELIGEIVIEGIARPFETTREDIEKTFRQFGHAVKQAAGIYQHILAAKGGGNFATEVSMDETDEPQTPPELLVILVALADAKIPVQTVAP
ncbi:MAG: tagaturonate epimerase family protein, partial [Verrucomicrobiales bacterium]